MAYGTVKVDNITFDNGGSDQNVTVSGLYRATTSGVTVTGTISGAVLVGTTTVSGATVTGTVVQGTTIQGVSGTFTSLTGTTTSGTTANFVSGVFTTQVSGTTITGTTSSFTSGNFATLSGATATFTSGVIASGTATNPSLSILGDPNTGAYSPGADQLGIVTDGVERIKFGSTEVVINDGGTDYDLRIEGDTNSTLFCVDASTDRVGIGTSSPTTILDVNGDVKATGIFSAAAGTATAPSIAFTGDLNTGIYSFGADQLAVATNGTGRLFVDASGNVGVGTASPLGTLHLKHATDVNIFFRNSTAAGLATGTLVDCFNDALSTATPLFVRASQFVFGTDVAGNLTERLRIDSSGNVGIGTSSPAEILDLAGNVQIRSTSVSGNPYLIFNSKEGAGGAERTVGQIQAIAESIDGWGLRFLTRPNGASITERLRIDSSGNVGIGTSSPRGLVSIANNAAGTGVVDSSLHFGYSLADYYGHRIVNSNEPADQAAGLLRFQRGTTAAWVDAVVIDNSGRVGIGTASPGAKLHVAGDALLGDDGTKGRLTIENTTSAVRLYATTTAFGAYEDLAFFADNYIFNIATTERARIDSSGRLLVGTSSARTSASHTGSLQLEGTTFNASTFSIIADANDASGSYIHLGKARGGSIGSTTIVADGDTLGQIHFTGADGTNLLNSSFISAQVDGTPGANNMPGRLVFSTTASGGSPTERLRITSAGVLQIADAGDITVGTTTGTKIGTATTQKIGFYNATPVVQPTAVADATDAATVITQLNALLTRMRNLGLIAT